jgi:flagellar motor protein MotB
LTEKHIKIRKEVESNLNKKKNDEPIEIEPLYFITGHEEFAFMDMEPFLKAVEYALHGKMVLIEGHTDSMGNDGDNLKLSMRRVSRSKQLMVDIGVNEDLISVIGYGEAEPKYDNNTEEGRQKNRRVDFKVF